MPILKNKYPSNWEEIRKAVLERAGNVCEGTPHFPFCGAINAAPHPKTGSKVVLTIAHLNHNTRDNCYSNLRALCQRCHLDWDKERHQQSKKYGRDFDGPHQLKLKLW